MTRRKRSDGAGQADIVRDALTGAPPPPNGVKISKAVQPFWEIVTTAKAKRAWTPNDLVLAADTARAMYRLEVVSKQIEKDLPLCISSPTPEDQRHLKTLEAQADMLARRVRFLSSHLQIHTEATQGKSREQVAQNKTHKDAKEFADATDIDDLISRPAH